MQQTGQDQGGKLIWLAGECRAHGNLGSAYFSKGNYKDALTSNRYQVQDHLQLSKKKDKGRDMDTDTGKYIIKTLQLVLAVIF